MAGYGNPLLVLGLIGNGRWVRLGSVFCMRLNFCILYFAFFAKKGRGRGGGIIDLYSLL